MSRIDELNEQARKTLDKTEQHLDAHSASMAATANIGITLGTALAGGLAIVAKDVLPGHPSLSVLVALTGAALTLVVSLLFGVLALDARSRISRKAVEMWDVSKQWALTALMMGQGNEQTTEIAFLAAAQTMAESLQKAATEYQNQFKWMSTALTIQLGLLLGSVAVALMAVSVAYWSSTPATVVQLRSTPTIPVSVVASIAPSSPPLTVVATTVVTTSH